MCNSPTCKENSAKVAELLTPRGNTNQFYLDMLEEIIHTKGFEWVNDKLQELEIKGTL